MLFTFEKQRTYLNQLAQSNSVLMSNIHLEKSLLSIVALLTSITLQVFRILNTKAHYSVINKLDNMKRELQPKAANNFLDFTIHLFSYPVRQSLLFLTEIISSVMFASFLTWQLSMEIFSAQLFSFVLRPKPQTIQSVQINRPQPEATYSALDSPTLTICGTPVKTPEKVKDKRANYLSDYEIPALVDYTSPSDHDIHFNDVSASEDDLKPVHKY